MHDGAARNAQWGILQEGLFKAGGIFSCAHVLLSDGNRNLGPRPRPNALRILDWLSPVVENRITLGRERVRNEIAPLVATWASLLSYLTTRLTCVTRRSWTVSAR